VGVSFGRDWMSLFQSNQPKIIISLLHKPPKTSHCAGLAAKDLFAFSLFELDDAVTLVMAVVLGCLVGLGFWLRWYLALT
jgi:hypothetical protein